MLRSKRLSVACLLLSLQVVPACSGVPAAIDGEGGGGADTIGSGGTSTGSESFGGADSNPSGGGGAGGGEVQVCTDWNNDLQQGTGADDEVLDMVLDPHGNLYVAGYEAGSTGSTNIEPAGNARGFVAKYGPTGGLVWRRDFETPGTDTVEAIAIEPTSGDVYAVGRTTGVLAGEVNQGKHDVFLAVLAADGELRATYQTGREQAEHPVQIALGDNGRVVIAGYDDLHVVNSQVMAAEDGFVLELKVDPSAGYAVVERGWQRQGSESSDRFSGLALDHVSGGNTYLAGFEDGGGAFLEKRDAKGVRRWLRSAAELGMNAQVVALSPEGVPHIAGFMIVPGVGPVIAVSKLDKGTGETVWITTAPSTGPAWVNGIALDASSHVYVTGYILGELEGGAPSAGSKDVFALNVDPEGTVVSTSQRGTAGLDVASSIAVDACGQAFMAGYTEGSFVEGQTNAGKRDGFVVRLVD